MSIADATPLLHEYSSRCLPPWSHQEVLRALNNASQEPGERGHLIGEQRSSLEDELAGIDYKSIRPPWFAPSPGVSARRAPSTVESVPAIGTKVGTDGASATDAIAELTGEVVDAILKRAMAARESERDQGDRIRKECCDTARPCPHRYGAFLDHRSSPSTRSSSSGATAGTARHAGT